jgi:hypothetical protein
MREQHAQNTKNRDIRHDKRRNCRKESIQMDLNFRNKLIWKRSKRLGNNLGKGTILVTSYFFTFTYCTYDCDAFLIRRRNSTISTCPSLEIFIPQCLAVIICTYLTHARSKYAMTMTQDFSNNHPLSTVGEYYAETTRGLLKTTPVIYQPFWTPLSAGIPPPTHAVCSKLIYHSRHRNGVSTALDILIPTLNSMLRPSVSCNDRKRFNYRCIYGGRSNSTINNRRTREKHVVRLLE